MISDIFELLIIDFDVEDKTITSINHYMDNHYDYHS